MESIASKVQIKHEVVIVDNASSDGSAEFIEKEFPGVNLIRPGENLGFAGGNNLGVENATGEYLLLLNNDTILHGDLSEGIALLANNSDIGIVGARMLGRKGEFRQSCGRFPEPHRLLILSYLYNATSALQRAEKSAQGSYAIVDWVEGSFMLMKKLFWRKIGGMDDGYFMYAEDVDFCKTALGKGSKTIYFPDIVYTHFGGYDNSRIALLFRGLRRYHSKHHSVIERILATIVMDIGLVGRLFASLPGVLRGDDEKKNKFNSCVKALLRRI